MTLIYKNEFINGRNGMPYAVLDMENSDFRNDPALTYGMKTAPTFALRGKPGQKVVTSQGGHVETLYECNGGEVIFINVMPDGNLDLYVPRDDQKNSTGEQILKTGYTTIAGDLESPRGGLFQPNKAVSKILFEVVKRPTVIVNAYGEGQHVFLQEGATLKLAGKNVSGINKIPFDVTWSLTDEQGNTTRPSRPPSPDFYSLARIQKVLSL